MSLTDALLSSWIRRGFLAWLLYPLSILFGGIAALRRALYRAGVFESVRLPRPVVVIGNITVGGSGKTPLTLWLAEDLRRRGFHPGIVSRGYGGAASRRGEVREVKPDDDPLEVGDEPLLMARRGICPVWVGRNRAAAGRALLAAHPECDLILCDDGLQHYRLARDVEVVVMDARGAGNGWLLPAGPLREPVSRLKSVDALVMNGGGNPPLAEPPAFAMQLKGDRFTKLDDPALTRGADAFRGLKLSALAGIGHPRRFFDHLAALGLEADCHAFPDHHHFCRTDINCFYDSEALLMTEKDGVKCAALALTRAWMLRVDADIAPGLTELIVEKLNGRPPA